MSFIYLKEPKQNREAKHSAAGNMLMGKSEGGDLPLGYMAWFLYSLLLAVRVGIIFEDCVEYLDEENVFGPNTLKVMIALSGIIFILLVCTHHDAESSSPRYTFIQNIMHSVTLDILDTVTILNLLFVQESKIFFTFSMHRVINGIACINLIIPTMPLIVLSRTRFGEKSMSSNLKTAHTFLNLCVVNLPMFIIRMYVWHQLNKDISVFVVKNVLGICFTIRGLAQHMCTAKDSTDGVDGKKVKVDDTVEGNELEALHSAEPRDDAEVIKASRSETDEDKKADSETFI